MMNRRNVLLGGAALAGTAALAGGGYVLVRGQNTSAGPEVVSWLKANAIPLASAEPGSGFDDLAPLRSLIGDARIVSLGEATHGTREFFQLKHRMMEYCISQLGFTMIGFEAEYGTTLAVNDYVLNGKGNALDVVTGMGFWIWDTEEVLALVEWVRAWNLAHERKVKFYGFDMQGSAAAALHLLAYLERVAPHIAAVAEQNLSPLTSRCTLGEFHRMDEYIQERTLAQIRTLIDAFTTERAFWISKAGETEWQLARQSAIVLEQFTRLIRPDGFAGGLKSHVIREQSMAGNIRALLKAEGPDAKALLWAHNGHVQRAPIPALAGLVDVVTMGSLLHAEFGDEMVVVGFGFNQGGFQARGGGDSQLRDHVVGPAPESFFDAALAATGIPLFALDLKHVPADGPAAKWMVSKPPQRSIGAVFDPARDGKHPNIDVYDPRSCFDVLLFVETTTAARGNKRPAQTDPATGANRAPTNLALAGSGAVPDGWRMLNRSLYPYAATVVEEESPGGGRAVRIARAGSPLPWGDGALTQSFPVTQWRGRQVVFSAAVSAEEARAGTGARLVVRVLPKGSDNVDAVEAIQVVQSDFVVSAPKWTRQSLAVDIPRDAERLQISLVVTGNAVGWFGDLRFDANGAVVAAGVGDLHAEHV
jgi:erythromycin esterase